MHYINHILGRIKRDPFHFWVNSVGLFVGFTALLLISTFLNYELKYDHHFEKYDQIYLLGVESQDHQTKYLINNNIGPSLKDEIPYFEETHFYNVFDYDIQNNEDVFSITMAEIDSSFFHAFDFATVSGSRRQLENILPGHAVITDKLAKRIFGETNLTGKSLFHKDNLGNVDTYIIDEVIKIPENSSVKADMFVSEVYKRYAFVWSQPSLFNYQWVVLKDGINKDNLNESIRNFSANHGMPDGSFVQLTALRDIHFSKNAELQMVFQTTNIQIIYLLVLVTLMILAIVVINYINFSLHYSLKQSKELGVRKAMGAQYGDLTRLFLLNGSIHFLVAVPLACYATYQLLPSFGSFLGMQVTGGEVWNTSSIVILISTIVILLSTSYWYYLALIKRKIPMLIKDSFQKSFGTSFNFRSGLVIVQICLSTILVIVSIGIYRQSALLKDRPIGFDSDHLLALPNTQLREKYSAFKNELLKNPDIISYTTSTVEIGALQQRNNTDTAHDLIETIMADFDFLKTLDIKLSVGNDFDNSNTFQRKYSTDYMLYDPDKDLEFQQRKRERPIIVTENLVDTYKITNPIGSIFADANGVVYGTIIGVCKPFELGPQKTKNTLKVILGDHDMFYGGFGFLRLKNENIGSSLKDIEKIWKKFVPNQSFSFSFVDDKINRLYQKETAMVTLTTSFAVLSMILSTLGVLGLLVILLNQRTKEIGIRKLLGASVSRLVFLMLKDTFIPVAVAMMLAIPIGALILHFWLADYVYRIQVSWWIFAIAVVSVLLATGIPVVLKTLQTAKRNLVESLRSE